ncbi:hypothetical protein [Sphingobacterium endophyticum]|uniref:hypothetical protein n=1 Tax=Sphingobacterium endophyticum TaxID=2546448 RepID=UPI0012E2F5EB|nr:hypothetical protein [Sphingobacterium endophyticum]
MKKIVAILTLILGCTFAASAQGFLDKIDRALNKVENTTNKVDNASGKAGRIGGKLNGLIGKKGDKEAEGVALTVLIEGVSLADLKKISTGLESNKKVSEVKMKYKATGSSLTVLFSGDSEELFEALKKTSLMITDETVQAIEDDGIAIKIEK